MSAQHLLRRLDSLGVGLTLIGDRIRYRSQGDQLPPELVAEMKEHRDELVSMLARRAELRWPPVRVDADGDNAGGDSEDAGDVSARRGPLTSAQRTLWATNYFLEDGTYNLCGALRLVGPLNTDAFADALDDVHRRHPSLRTVFPVEQGEPRQQILPQVDTPVSIRDFTHHPVALAFDECVRECAELADRQLALEPSPPVLMNLYRLAESDHVFFVVLHHVIADGVSLGVLLEDLAQCYNARLDGEPMGASAGAIDMLDYARWEEDHLRYADLGAARRYWRDRLTGATVGALPLPPPLSQAQLSQAQSDDRGGAFTAVVDPATTTAVRQLVSTSRSSAFLVVSAAISSMLSRYTGRDDLIVGMPVARRDRAGLEKLVGLLLDLVPVRLDVSANLTFLDLVKRTRTAVLGAVSNALEPAELMASEHETRGDAAGRTLFNVLLTDIGTDLPDPRFRGLDARRVDVPQVGAKYDLNFLIRDAGDTLSIDVEYNRRAVSETDVAAMTSMVRRILALGAANPRRRAADLAAAPFGEVGAGAVGVGAVGLSEVGVSGSVGTGADESLVSRLAELARTRGDAVALTHDAVTLSYQGFARLVDQVARGLRQQGVGAGEVVAIALPRGIDLVVAIVGVMASGAACLVLDDSWPPARVDRILADAGTRRLIAVEPDSTGETTTVARLTELGAAELGAAELGAAVEPGPPIPSNATAYVIYTSGSTGQPKGVHVTHRNVLSLLDATRDRYDFGAADTWTLFHACSFDVSMYEMFGCLLHGGRLVVVPKWITREPDAFAQLLRRERVTVLSQTPSALSVMLPAIARNKDAAEHLRYIIFAGEALDRRLVDQWYRKVSERTQLVNMYGITETTVHASWQWLRPDDAYTAESDIGEPLPGTSLHLLHDNGTAVLNRCVGEIYVGGAQVSAGYLGRPRETALRFVPDPFSPVPGVRMYRSGDLARRNGSSLSYLGRRDSQVQVNGFRVELPEIEDALAAQPGVAAAAAAIATDDSGPRIVAIVVANGQTELSTTELLRAARAALPRYMVPHSIEVVEKLPLTVNGKLDRGAVAARTAVTAASQPPSAPPRGAAETLLLELYREVLYDTSISTAADFFDLGGDSMRAIHLISVARDRGLLLTVGDIYAAPRLTDLATRAVLTNPLTGAGPNSAAGPNSGADWNSGAGPESVAGLDGADDPDSAADSTAAAGRREPFSLLSADLAGSFPADVEDAYPMTALQSGMIYLQELAPDSRLYHIMLSYRVGGAMDPVAFRAAAQAVTDAHPVLRTSFDLSHTDGPMQRVHTDIEVPVRFEDLSHLDPADQSARVQQVVDAEIATGFDLARPPLLRLVVLIRSAADYQLIFSHHHAILDGWSVNMFFDDLHSGYLDRLGGGSPGAIPRPRTLFADYVALEQRAIHDRSDQEFWRERTSAPASLIAPDRSGEPVMRQLRVDLPEGTIAELRAVAARVGVPVKALLLASHIRVVAWLTGDDLVVTGHTYSCRPEEQDSDRMLGLFLNELPMRLRLDRQTWAELAQQAHRDELDMLRHRWYPHALIQQHHGPRPIFDSHFNFTDFHTTRKLVRDGSIEVLDAFELENTHYVFGTVFTIDVRTHELRLIAEYDEAAVARSTVALAVEAHRRALAAIVADPDTVCTSTSLPGVADLARLIERGRPELAATPTNNSTPARTVGAPAAADTGRESTTAAPTAAQVALEHGVREVWVEVLGAGDYGVHTSFFAVGGSSLAAMQVVSRLRARHGQLSMKAFMDAPTIADIARSLSAAPALGSPPAPDRLDPSGDEPRRYPLTQAQHQMWLLASRLPGVALFGMPGALRADGPLDLGVLERVFAALIRRHEALRTRVSTTDDGHPEQVVEAHAELDIEVVDVSPDADPVRRCESLMAAAVREPLALDHAPLMRVTVYRLGADRHVIYLNIHHIVCDGWSLSLLLREAAQSYQDLVVGVDAGDRQLPLDRPLPIGSGRLAQARLEWAGSPDAQRQRRYWTDQLAPPRSSIAGGPESRFHFQPASVVQRLRSAACQCRLDATVVDLVREAARRHGLTEFMVMLTAFAATLRSWSGQDDIRIATMLANRAQPGTEEVVGLVANSVVLRLDVSANADPVELSRHARLVCVDAYDHQELPFEDVLAALETRYAQDDRSGPVFEVMLVMQEETEQVGPDDGLRLSPYSSDSTALNAPLAATTCDFVLAVTPAHGELRLNLMYKPATTDRQVAVDLLDDIAAAVVATAQALLDSP